MTSCGLRSAACHDHHVHCEWPHRRAAVAASFGRRKVAVMHNSSAPFCDADFRTKDVQMRFACVVVQIRQSIGSENPAEHDHYESRRSQQEFDDVTGIRWWLNSASQSPTQNGTNKADGEHGFHACMQ